MDYMCMTLYTLPQCNATRPFLYKYTYMCVTQEQSNIQTLYNINVSCFVLSRDVILCALPFILQRTKIHTYTEHWEHWKSFVLCRLHCRYCNNPEKVDHYNNIKIKYAAVATPGKIQSRLLYKFVHTAERRKTSSMTLGDGDGIYWSVKRAAADDSLL